MLLSGDLTQTFIATARLTMAAFKPADARESFIEANDRIARFMSWNPPESEDAYRAIWQASLADMKIGRQLSLVTSGEHKRIHRFGGLAAGGRLSAGDRRLD